MGLDEIGRELNGIGWDWMELNGIGWDWIELEGN